MSTTAKPYALVFAPALDFAQSAAQRLVELHRHELPDLRQLTLLVPDATLIAPLRSALAVAAGGAVLAPRIQSLRDFAAADAPAALAPLHCRLRLADELARHRGIFPGQNPERAADAVFALCEELTLSQTTPSTDEAAFTERLRTGYGAPDSQWLSRESQIVHRLWLAYRESFGDAAPAAAYVQGLRAAAMATKGAVYWLGFDQLTACERAVFSQMLGEQRAAFWTQGRLDGRDGLAIQKLLEQLGLGDAEFIAAPPSPRGALLDAALSLDALAPRSRQPSASVQNHGLRLVSAADPEQEARCVDLAVREAVLGGAKSIAIVTDDRRLSRRLRALLERAGIALHDRVGWPLSTSRAAAALDAWLAVIEREAHYRPLFDLLRSGFFGLDGNEVEMADELARRLVYGKPGIVAGWRNWQQALRRVEAPPALGILLERLQRAAAELPVQARARAAAEWPAALRNSLHAAGLLTVLKADEAGTRLMDELALLESTLSGLARTMGWAEFRALLDQRVEEARFGSGRPTDDAALRVMLLGLDQTHALRADVVILASLTPAQLPGLSASTPFFNAAVRAELGLESTEQRQALALARFRRALEAAPAVMLSHAPETAGEPATVAPWVDALAAFAAACGAPMEEISLPQRAALAVTEIVDHSPLPEPALPAAPAAAPELIDWRLSATAHQALMDCPYRFHARNALQLAALQAPDAPPGRADFGEIVHRILSAFHQTDSRLPAPWTGPLDAAHRAEITEHLCVIASAAFAAEIEKRPLSELWQREFLALAPWLAGQLIERGTATVEVELPKKNARAGWELAGTADRIEHQDGQRTLIDYKTGRTPDKDAIESGEAVQLPHYALLFGGAQRVEYWDLKKQRVVGVEGETLAQLLPAVERRLLSAANRMRAGAAMPASGEHRICERCEYSGLCRHWALARGDA